MEMLVGILNKVDDITFIHVSSDIFLNYDKVLDNFYKKKKNSNDYFKCKSLKRSYLLGASLHYPVLMDWDSYRD